MTHFLRYVLWQTFHSDHTLSHLFRYILYKHKTETQAWVHKYSVIMPRQALVSALYYAVVVVRAVQILEQPYQTDVSKHLEQVSTLFAGFALLSIVSTIMLEVEQSGFSVEKNIFIQSCAILCSVECFNSVLQALVQLVLSFHSVRPLIGHVCLLR